MGLDEKEKKIKKVSLDPAPAEGRDTREMHWRGRKRWGSDLINKGRKEKEKVNGGSLLDMSFAFLQ